MPLNNSGPISIGGSTVGQSINLELGRAATASSNLNESALRTLAGVPSGAISLSNFYGKSAGGTFSPDGSISSGSRTIIGMSGGNGPAFITVNCTENATWTYARVTGTFGSADVSSGGAATSITFTLPLGGAARSSSWNLDATSGSNTRYWLVQLDNDGSACPTCCFTPDTLITMADGTTKPIIDIQIGDLILSRDEETGLNIFATVQDVIVREDRTMYEFQFANGNILNASEDHPLFTLNKGWASVAGVGNYKDLKTVNVLALGDIVVDQNNVSTEIISINPIEFNGRVFTLGNTKFYANGILVY